MRRIAILLALALALSGCTAYRVATASVKNPVTVERMYQIEQAMVVTTAGLNTYKSLCVQKVIDQKCRDVIVQLQSFTRPAQKQLVTLRAYFKNNDTLNAINAYNAVVQLLADARSVAVANGVAIQ